MPLNICERETSLGLLNKIPVSTIRLPKWRYACLSSLLDGKCHGPQNKRFIRVPSLDILYKLMWHLIEEKPFYNVKKNKRTDALSL